MTKRHGASAIAVGLAITLAVAACSGDDDEAGDGSSDTSGAASSGATSTVLVTTPVTVASTSAAAAPGTSAAPATPSSASTPSSAAPIKLAALGPIIEQRLAEMAVPGAIVLVRTAQDSWSAAFGTPRSARTTR